MTPTSLDPPLTFQEGVHGKHIRVRQGIWPVSKVVEHPIDARTFLFAHQPCQVHTCIDRKGCLTQRCFNDCRDRSRGDATEERVATVLPHAHGSRGSVFFPFQSPNTGNLMGWVIKQVCIAIQIGHENIWYLYISVFF